MNNNLTSTIVKFIAGIIVYYALPVTCIILDVAYGISTLNCGILAAIGTWAVYIVFGTLNVLSLINFISIIRGIVEFKRQINSGIKLDVTAVDFSTK
jgi:hypothetical protein